MKVLRRVPMMTEGIFFSHIHDLQLIPDIVSQHSLSKLFVCLISSEGIKLNEGVCQKITSAYSNANSSIDLTINLDNLKGHAVNQKWYPKTTTIFSTTNSIPSFFSNINPIKITSTNKITITGDPLQFYENVVLGGTFDRLHTGHKILLTEAILRCTKKLTVGVTDQNMIKSKILWELIEPVEKRIENVQYFLESVDSSLEYSVVPIGDVYGPTATDPDLKLLVVSDETIRGGVKVNELRESRNLPILKIHSVQLVEDTKRHNSIEESKISSSNGRIRALGTRLKVRQSNTFLKPYLIGLTGNICSGKSNIAKYLVEIGQNRIGHIDCDKIAHSLYEPGKEAYYKVVDLFGKDILKINGEIDRKKLGAIVFGDSLQLNKLNKLLWPLILDCSLSKAKELGKEVVVLEAAVLLQAKWHSDFHEVWSCIIPPNEAIKRLVERNGLAEEDAAKRLASQPSNSEYVAISDVIFSSYWSYECTRSQVDKAWNELQSILS